MPQLHLPVQSGSDRILAAMNRRHTRADYLDIVRRLRDARPDLALTSDFIVGFPGETESDFAATLSLIDEIGFSGAFSFKYSPRPGTPGAEMDDQVDESGEVGALAAPARRDRPQPGGVQSPLSRPHLRCAVRTARPPCRPDWSAARPICSRCRSTRRHRLIGEIAAVTITEIASNSLFGALAQNPRHSPHHRPRKSPNESPLVFGAGA